MRALACALAVCCCALVACDTPPQSDTLNATTLTLSGDLQGSALQASALGASISAKRSAPAILHALPELGAAEAFVVDLHLTSLDARLDLQSRLCERAIVIFELSQRAEGVLASARPYLESIPVSAQSLTETLTGLSLSRDPHEPLWTPMGEVRAVEVSRAAGGARLGFLISRSERLARPLSAGELARAEGALLASVEGVTAGEVTPPPPCVEALTDDPAPLTLLTRLRLAPQSPRALTLAVISDLRATDERLSRLTEALNASQIDGVIFNGGALSSGAGRPLSGPAASARVGALGALTRPWFALPSVAELGALGEGAWGALLGGGTVVVEAGETRLVALAVSAPFDGAARAQLTRWGGDSPLVWEGGPTPLQRLMLTPTPLSPLDAASPLEPRAPLVRFLDEVAASGFTRLISMGAQEPHGALQTLSIPSFAREGQWVELSLLSACDAEALASGGCLEVVARALADR